jgi:hypothetical protein
VGSGVILPTPGQPTTGPDTTFKSATVPNLVSFGIDKVAPPSPLYIQRDDIVQLFGMTTKPGGEIFNAIIRFLEAAPDVPGQPDKPSDVAPPEPGATQTIKTVSVSFACPQDSQTTSFFALGEGYLLSIAGNTLSVGGNVRGVSFMRAALSRPPIGLSFTSQSLFADYVTRTCAPGWPGGRILSSGEGTGQILSFQVANPAAGADWTLVVPGFRKFYVQSFQAQFVASAAVANRNISVIVDDGVNAVWTHDVSAAVTAGQTVQVVGSGTSAPVGIVPTILPLVLPPGLRLTNTMRIRSSTANLQAGDQWSNIWFLVESLIDA